MIIRTIVLLSLIASLSASAQNAPTLAWQRTLGGSGYDVLAGHLATADGGYIVLGSTASTDGDLAGMPEASRRSGDQATDIWLVKLDASRNIEWQTIIGGSAKDTALFIDHTGDGGYIIAAYTFSTDGDFATTPGTGNSVLIHVGPSGSIGWSRKFEGYITSIRQISNGNYIYCGIGTAQKAIVGQLDGSGKPLWTKDYDAGLYGDIGYDIYETPDNGFIFSGNTYQQQWVVKLDNAGIVEWENKFGNSSADRISSIELTSDNGYAIIGTKTEVTGNYMSVTKLTANGTLVTQQLYEDDISYGRGLRQLGDGGFLCIGVSSVSAHLLELEGLKDILVYRTDASGNIVWKKTLGGSNPDYGTRSISFGPKDEYTLSGVTFSNDGDVSNNHGSADIWIAHLSEAASHVTSEHTATVSLFPVPTSGSIHLKTSYGVPVTVTITDLEGRTVRTMTEVPTADIEINVSNLANGTYFISLRDGNSIIGREKFIRD